MIEKMIGDCKGRKTILPGKPCTTFLSTLYQKTGIMNTVNFAWKSL